METSTNVMIRASTKEGMGDEDRRDAPSLQPLPPMPSTTMFNPAFAVTSSANPVLPKKLGTSLATSVDTSPTSDAPESQMRHASAPIQQQRLGAAPRPLSSAPPPQMSGAAGNSQPSYLPLGKPAHAESAPSVPMFTQPSRQVPVIEPRSSRADEKENWWDKFSKEFLGGLDCCAPPDRNKKSDRRQAMCGVGLILKEVGYGELMVDQVLPGSPAQGYMLPGDEITEIDDTYVYRKRKDLVQGLLMGAEGTYVSLVVKRVVGGREEAIKMHLMRRP